MFDRLLAGFGAGVFDEAAQLGHIARPMHHPGDGGQAIAAAPARFLVIGLQALGQIHVRHKAHVRFVDAHAKGDCGHHDHAAVAAKPLQHGRAPLGIESGVISEGVKARGGELLGQAVDPLARAGVDDASFPLAGRQERLQLGARTLLLPHQVGDVGPIEAGQEHPVVLQAQALADVFAGAAIGGGGEGQAGNGWEPLGQHGQLQVLGPEIVAPLGDAMGLINGEQGNRQLGQAIEAVARQQPLRREIDQVEIPGAQGFPGGLGQLRPLGRMQGGGAHTGLAQGRHLVVHQGDQGRDHHAGARAAEGRDLITEGFAAAGGHQHQGRATAHHMANDLGLGAAKGAIAEHLSEDLEGIGAGGWGRRHRGSGSAMGKRAAVAMGQPNGQ